MAYIWKERKKMSLFADMIVYLENPKRSTDQWLASRLADMKSIDKSQGHF